MTIVVAEDPYQILLGNRINVKLHCFVVVASFIFFGVIPPLFYGLSFKRSNKKHYKAVVVFVVSLLCVIFLSFAKAYAFDMDILKTMFEYTGIAIGASTLSFVTSKIVSGMLEK
ncbi:unnamed protein product [Arabis nemorensis]|uniref:Uncharacterized protein n=1 Tax=Arabis nemorensis TaxID=586526 RepID=A0A565B1P2_9BRAS|nr:unnamed protein product [Arabis nemorensis]